MRGPTGARATTRARIGGWATGIYELPFGKEKRLVNRTGLMNAIFGGWQIGAIWQYQSGEVIDWGNAFYYGTNLHDIALPPSQRTPERWFNTDNFERDSTKTASSYHRRVFPQRMNWLGQDDLEQLDLNVQKSFLITESFKALFRVDLLNAPNHPVLVGPSTDPTSTSFGRITGGTVNTPCYVQFQLRLTF